MLNKIKLVQELSKTAEFYTFTLFNIKAREEKVLFTKNKISDMKLLSKFLWIVLH